MMDILLALLILLIVMLIFFRRWYLLEKATLFGKMVVKKGFHLPGRLTREDHEVTPKEMIPDPETIDPRLRVKGSVFGHSSIQRMP